MKRCISKYKLANRGLVAAVLKGTFHAAAAAGWRGGFRLPDKTAIVSPLRVRADKNYFEWEHNGGGAYGNPDTSLKKAANKISSCLKVKSERWGGGGGGPAAAAAATSAATFLIQPISSSLDPCPRLCHNLFA